MPLPDKIMHSRRALAGILIGERLRLQLIKEMLDIAQEHEREADPFARKRLEDRFNALHALVKGAGELSAPGSISRNGVDE